jgi:5-methylcytosine-specific restriction endonuclease McrA
VNAFCKDRGGITISEEKVLERLSCNSAKEPVDMDAPHARTDTDSALVIVVRKTGRTPAPRLRFRVFQRDNFICKICGRSPATHLGLVLHVDHHMAWSKGGETLFENLQTLCMECNIGKSDL